MHPLRIANVGSSFAAGPGLPPYSDRAAGRSARNAASLVAHELRASLHDVSVGGATMENLVSREQRVRGHTYAPQLHTLRERSRGALDLVMITVGGNDLGYIGHALLASLAYRLGRRRFLATLAERARPTATPVEASQRDCLTEKLVRVVDQVRSIAPGARIMLVGYLTIVPPDSEDGVGFDARDARWLRRTANILDDTFARAARQTGAEFVDMGAKSAEHGVGTTLPWIRDAPEGLRLRDIGAAFHPNTKGMQSIADAVVQQWQH